MASNAIYVETLRRVAERVGGVDELALRLHIQPGLLNAWLGGVLPCPSEMFLKAVDVLVEEDLRPWIKDIAEPTTNGPPC